MKKPRLNPRQTLAKTPAKTPSKTSMCVLGFQYERAASPLAATPLTAYRSGDAAYIRAAGPLELSSGVAAHYYMQFSFCSMRPHAMFFNARPRARNDVKTLAHCSTAMHCNMTTAAQTTMLLYNVAMALFLVGHGQVVVLGVPRQLLGAKRCQKRPL